MIERIDMNGMPPEPMRRRWCEWLEFHTIDPRRVLVDDGFIERRPEVWQVAYRAAHLNREGDPHTVLACPDLGQRTEPCEYANDLCIVTEIAQLESPPNPFPIIDWGKQ
ncbi:MAG: hypothetical protein ACRDQA_07460 [Nocardioidaceae bacterium]